MITSKQGKVTIEGTPIELLGDLTIIIESLREEGVMPRTIYDMVWILSKPESSEGEGLQIDIKELKKQVNENGNKEG